MLKVCSILVTRQCLALCVVALTACGQKGPLQRPTDDTSRGRATLIETLTPEALRTRTPSTDKIKPALPDAAAPGTANTPPTPPQPVSR